MDGWRGGMNGREDLERLAREAGRAMDRTVGHLEIVARQVFDTVSREARAGARELLQRACVAAGEARSELPRLRAELREMEARVRDRVR